MSMFSPKFIYVEALTYYVTVFGDRTAQGGN